MTIRRSTKLVNDLALGYGVRELLHDGRIFIYSGAQPTDADTAPSGTLLMTFTESGNSYTDATRALATIAIGGSATGTIATIKVGGMGFNLLSAAVDFTTSATVTAGLIADNINALQNPLNIVAVASTTNVLLYTPYWLGAEANGLTFATTTTGSLTATSSGSFASGVTAVNGINFGETVTDGQISKESATWQAEAVASGTAGWFRFIACGSTVDGVADEDIRFDGNVGTSNADLIISTTAVVSGAIHTVSTAPITEPTE
jgi:hypothetical protein